MPSNGFSEHNPRDPINPQKVITPINQHVGDEQVDTIDVLHVDDEPELGEMTAEFIERIDDRFDVTAVTSVDQAVKRYEQKDFDCIISDYQMPEMDGLDFLEAIRRNDPNLPFILFTGKGSEEIASEAIARGVTDYLQKGRGTDQYEVLVNRVRNVVEASRTERELRTALSWYQRLVEQNLAGMYLIQQEEFVFVNKRLADIFGYTQEELIGRSPTILVDERDHALLLENLRRREEGEENSIHYTLRGKRKDGSAVNFDVHGGEIEFKGAPAVMGLLLET